MFYILPGDLKLPRDWIKEDWIRDHAIGKLNLEEAETLEVMVEGTVVVREYGEATVGALYEGLEDKGMQEHVNLAAGVSAGFKRKPGTHRMEGNMDLQGQRRTRNITVFQPVVDQASYATVSNLSTPLVFYSV